MNRRRQPGAAPRGLAAVAALALVAAAVLVAAPTGEAATTRALVITAASSGSPTAFKAFDGNPPKTFDIDGDGRQEILAQNDNDNLYVFHSGTGKLLATLKSTYPAGWGARTFNGPEAYRQDGVTHVVQMNSAAYLTSWRFDAEASTPTSFVFVKEWQRRQTDCFAGPGSDSKPVLADLDRDGKLEILVSTEESGIYALRNTGQLYWKKCIGGGNGEPRPTDLNLDGWLDVVFASDGGVVTAMQGRPSASCTPAPCPNTMWGFNIKSRYNLSSASVPVGAGIGQLDGLAGPDIVVGARDSHDAVNWTNDHALLLALSSTGQVLWAKQDLVDGNPLTYTHPMVVDADGDGRNEVYWGDWNTIGHKPPDNEADAWKSTGPAHFYRYDHQGNLVWKQTLGTFWSNKDLALADVDGDGRQEVLAAGPNGGHDGLWYLDSATGAKEAFVDVYPWQVTRGPIVADLAGDGTMQVVVEAGPMATTAGAAIHVYNTGVPYNALWPHVPGPPGTTPPPPPPPPPTGEFGATFTIKSPNAWWQEVSIQPDSARAIAKAEVRINNGDWEPMAKSSWGAWTSSRSTPAGAKVEFLATDTANNLVSQSAAFTWMDGTLSKRSVPCGCIGGSTSSTSSTTTPTATTSPTTTSTSSSTTTTAGPFTASFLVPSGVNEWWVEARVTANQPLALVEARVNSGPWTQLPATTWGTHGKSLSAPQGSQVTFRAANGGGDVLQSEPFTWPAAGQSSTGSPPSPSPTPTGSTTTSSTGLVFQATFDPKAVGNDWWIEVAVAANQPLAKVEAQRDGGAFAPLDRQSWGNWAKSLNAPDGTVVVFRATSTGGATATSTPVVWS